jgi:hypothetical protein
MPAEDQIDQLQCINCGDPLVEGDRFCGNCGTPAPSAQRPAADAQAFAADGQRPAPTAQRPAPWPGTPEASRAVIEEQDLRPAQSGLPAESSASFFEHAPSPPAQPVSNATRHLSAAAYLSSSFANRVIGELIASHRAVAPSRGIDLEPIIRHCLKARRMKFIRDVVLSVLLLVGLVTATVPLVFVLAVTFLGGFLPAARMERRSFGGKALAGLAAFIAVLVLGGILTIALVVIAVVVVLAKLASSVGGSAGTVPTIGLFSAGFFGLWSLVYVVILIGTLVSYFWRRDKMLAAHLRPGATAPTFRRESPRVENRIAEVCRAQYGNVALYDTRDPFIGMGFIPSELFFSRNKEDRPLWSIAIELSRAGAPRGLLGFKARDRVDIDPVDLHKVLRTRLENLNDPTLPASQRVAYITVDDHLVGEGKIYWDSPLIDRQRKIPYSQALPEAIEALIRAPQGRLRYYQRVSISDEGQPVLTEDRRQVIGSVDREVITSAFIYVAVEGHMFYLQFIPKALTPIDSSFQTIDLYPISSSSRFAGKVLQHTLQDAFRDILTAPYKVYKALRLSYREWRSFTKEARADADFAVADVGARIGVRELGSQGRLQTYIEDFDIDKYTRIVERLVLETVLDYLGAKGADTAAYRAAAASIVNGDVYNANTVGNWNVNTGVGTQTVRATGA